MKNIDFQKNTAECRGRIFDPIIQSTIDEMRRIKPDYDVPMHFTGWKNINRFAINRFAEAMPEQFLLNAVDTTYVFNGN